jgi:hypothetical protein
MLKKSVLILMVLSLGACASTPLTQEENEQGAIQSVGIEACFQKGWVQNPQVMANYLSMIQSNLANRGNPTLVAQYSKKWQGAVPNMTPADCRKLEMYALQHAQREAEYERDVQELGDTLDGITQNNIQQMNATRPRTTMCQSAGIMVACNTF